ncbi:putative mitochondrial transporter UCP3 [Leptosomus discolor]
MKGHRGFWDTGGIYLQALGLLHVSLGDTLHRAEETSPASSPAAGDELQPRGPCQGAEGTGLAARVLAGCTTGAVAVTCAQPTDVVKVRFQANGALPDGARRYSGTVDAYRTIAREEGVRGLWRGTLPNITRNAIVNCGELVTYDLIKDALLQAQLMTDNVPCHFVAAFGAGFCATVVASPVDVVKTRYMNASPGQYRNVLSCLLGLLMQDGPAGFYKGFVPSFLRLGSWNVVMFLSYEQLQRAAVLAWPARS